MAKRNWLESRDADNYFEDIQEQRDGYGPDAPEGRIWTECVQEYCPLGEGKILEVNEGVRGEDRFDFKCGHCGRVHRNAMALRG